MSDGRTEGCADDDDSSRGGEGRGVLIVIRVDEVIGRILATQKEGRGISFNSSRRACQRGRTKNAI